MEIIGPRNPPIEIPIIQTICTLRSNHVCNFQRPLLIPILAVSMTNSLHYHILPQIFRWGLWCRVLYSHLIQNPDRESNELIHITDWFPTLLRLAGMNSSTITNIDGFDQWDTLQNGRTSERNEVLLNIRHFHEHESNTNHVDNAALKMGDWKIIQGQRKCSTFFYQITKIKSTAYK